MTGGTIAGISKTYLTGPLTAGVDGGAPTVVAQQIIGAMDALGLPGGGIIVANTEAGALHTFRDAVAVDGPDIGALLGPGCCHYHPSLGRDGSGRVWLAWYSNVSGNVGIYMVQLDPATAAAIGTPVKAPESQSPANNGFHLALACNAAPGGVCRIVYGAQASPTANLRLASWSPGEAAATTIGTPSLSLGLPLAAAYRADGRLWVAWFDSGTGSQKHGYAAKLGSATGGGGTVQRIATPAGFVDARDLEAVAYGNDLVLAGTMQTTAPRGSVWTTLVQDPSQLIESPRTIKNGPATVVAPKRVSIKNLKKTKCVRVNVSTVAPARIKVAIFSGTKSIRLFGQAVVVFPTAPASKLLCIRVPLRAHTFDVRTPARIAVAVRKGASPKGPPAKVVTRSLRFF